MLSLVFPEVVDQDTVGKYEDYIPVDHFVVRYGDYRFGIKLPDESEKTLHTLSARVVLAESPIQPGPNYARITVRMLNRDQREYQVMQIVQFMSLLIVV